MTSKFDVFGIACPEKFGSSNAIIKGMKTQFIIDDAIVDLLTQIDEVEIAARNILPLLWGPTPELELELLQGSKGALVPLPDGGWRMTRLVDHINAARIAARHSDLLEVRSRLDDARRHLIQLAGLPHK
jgi:hypothetical protein